MKMILPIQDWSNPEYAAIPCGRRSCLQEKFRRKFRSRQSPQKVAGGLAYPTGKVTRQRGH